MRILHFITSLRTGGAERLIVNVLPHLRDLGHTVAVLTMDGSRTHFTDVLQQRGVPVESLSCGAAAMHNPMLLMRLRRFIRNGGYDIVHTHNSPCQILAAAAVPHGCSLITTEHNTTNRRRSSSLWHPLDHMMYSRYKAIIAVSEATADSLRAYLPSTSDKIHIVPNGIDAAAFCGADAAPDILSHFPGKKIIAMVAAFRPQKDHATMLKALSMLPDDYTLVLAGDGDTLPAVRAEAAACGVSERVLFAGARSDVGAVYAAADVAVQSSHYEGFGLSAIEAMASGTPLIASDVDGLRDTATPGGILFPEGDAAALAHTIRAVCSNPSLQHTLAEAGRRRAQDFDVTRTAQEYHNVYINTTLS